MRARRLAAVLAIALLAPAASAAAAPPHKVDGKLGDWRGAPTAISGRTTLSRGEVIYTDWLYDDFGPNLDGNPSDMTPWAFNFYGTQGDYRYPTNERRYGYNAADLRELRVAADRTRLYLLVSLQTMLAKNAAAAMLAIDTDGIARTGTKTWPDGVGVDTHGPDRFVTLWGTGGNVRDARGRLLGRPREAVNVARNAIEASFPLKLLGKVSSRARIWFVTGLADPAHRRFMPVPFGSATQTQPGGGGADATAAFNVAFRPNEPHGNDTEYWSDEAQAAALAKRDVAPFARALPLRAMQRRKSGRFTLRPGYYNAVFRSRHDFGEGIDLQTNLSGTAAGLGNAQPQFKSRYQPYGVYVPRGFHRRGPLTIFAHASLDNQNQWVNNDPNLYKQLGDDRRAVVITPLGRGHINFYLSAGLDDVLGALTDAQRRFHTDPLQTTIGGYSMGGYLAFRLGLLMPDRFARASAYNPPPAYAVWAYPAPPVGGDQSWIDRGITTGLIENGLNLPFEIIAGDTDEEVPISGVRHQVDRFDALGRPYRFYEHAVANHTARSMFDEWSQTRAWLGSSRIDPNPAQVVYKRYPIMDLPRLGYRFDGAYWIDDVAVRSNDRQSHAGPDEYGMVDVTTHGLGRRRPATVPESFLYPGPPLPATVRGRRPVPGPVIPRSNAFDATFTNVSRVTLHTRRMRLQLSGLSAQLRGDGAIRLMLVGRPEPVLAELDGKVVTANQTRHGLELLLGLAPGSLHHLALIPAPPR